MYLCGCYHLVATPQYYSNPTKHYLPLVNSESHTTILSTTSRTTLKQNFTNPLVSAIKECIYTFPLYDGVSVVSFTCQVGTRILRGLVKEKNQAKKIYNEAVAKGESAGLLTQLPEASDVFSTKLGNVPAGETVVVEITYVGELKHDTETNGIRFTIPTKIAPRYGNIVTPFPGTPAKQTEGIKVTVDAIMAEGSLIQGIQSPSHPIAVTMGTTSHDALADPTMSRASATLSLGSSNLDHDFILIVLAKDTATPKAFLETHPTIPHHRALMATLVPKFSLPPGRPEIVFVVDRSGSMQGKMSLLASAMKVFVKSLPVGVKFNICSFGTNHSFLWKKSQSYSEDSLVQALSFIDHIRADMGGTETFNAIKATIEARYGDIPLEVMLLTDGDIWQQENLFKYLNKEVEKSKGDIRVFPLGIGTGVSSALIEGVARASNGFAQIVQEGEKLDNRVVRMLKGALSPHVSDYTLEVQYGPDDSTDDNEYELVDKVTDGMRVLLSRAEEPGKEKAPISLFDTSVDPDKEEKIGVESTEQSRYNHLPPIPPPALLQAPQKIPPLFPFTRTTVYLLMSPSTIQKNPIALVLRGTSPQGPLQLSIPIEVLPSPAETIHQLAARKAVQDLEEGRGWLYEARDDKNTLLKQRFPSKFEDMREREAVRLGVQFQVANRWCSFVAVAANDKDVLDKRVAKGRRDDVVVAEGEPRSYKYASMSQLELRADRRFVTRTSDSDFFAARSSASEVGMASPIAHAANAQALRAWCDLGKDSEGSARDFASGSSHRHSRRRADHDPTPKRSSIMFARSTRTKAEETRANAVLPIDQNPPAYSVSDAEDLIDYSDEEHGSHLTNRQSQSAQAPTFLAPPAARLAMPAPPLPTSIDYDPCIGDEVHEFSSDDSSHNLAHAAPSAHSSRIGTIEPGKKTSMTRHIPLSMSYYAQPQQQQSVPMAQQSMPFGPAQTFGSRYDSAASGPYKSPNVQYQAFMHQKAENQSRSGLFGAQSTSRPAGSVRFPAQPAFASGTLQSAMPKMRYSFPAPPVKVDWAGKSDAEKVHRIIALQDFEGGWGFEESLGEILGVGQDAVEAMGMDVKIWMTVLVVVFLRERMKGEEEVWELVVEKARMWLEGKEVELERLEGQAKKVLRL